MSSNVLTHDGALRRADVELIITLNDPALSAYIESDERSRERFLEELLDTKARPVIEQVIARHTRVESTVRPEDAEDISSTVMLRLVRKLRLIPHNPDDAIQRFEDYVAKLTYNAVYDLLRRRFPQRTRLKNRLRYLLTHDERFALWTSGGILTCGLAQWKGEEPFQEEFPISHESVSENVRNSYRPAYAVWALFRHVGRPIRFEALIRVLMTIWRIAEGEKVDVEELCDRLPSQSTALESRQYLDMLWSEIRLLRPMQRAALLLNLRDHEGSNAAALFMLIEVATFGEIAEAVGLSSDRLSEIWTSLPVDDLSIAALLGVTRQQVINLRKSARERLARRMAAAAGRPPIKSTDRTS